MDILEWKDSAIWSLPKLNHKIRFLFGRMVAIELDDGSIINAILMEGDTDSF